MNIVRFAQVTRNEWDALVESSPDAWLTHRSDWIAIETEFFVRRNLSFAVSDRSGLVAVQPLYLSDAAHGTPNAEILIHSGIHRHSGTALRAGLAKSDAARVRSAAMQAILDVARSFGAHRVQLNSHNLAPRNRTADREHIPFWVTEHGFQLGLGFGPTGMEPAPGFSVCNADQIVDLREAEEEIWLGLDEACRRAVRKAQKAGLTFSLSQAPDRLDRYLDLARKSSLRTGEVLPPSDYYSAILERFADSGNVLVAFARSEERDAAALILLAAKQGVSFLAGVSDPDMLAMRPNDFIHWHAILEAKKAGFEAYRFGPTFPEVPSQWPIAKVSSFKGKFGGRAIPIIQGSLFLDSDRAVSAAEAAPSTMRSLGASTSSAKQQAPAWSVDSLVHQLRLFGVTGASADLNEASVVIADAAIDGSWVVARQAADSGKPVILLRPSRAQDFLDDVSFSLLSAERETICTAASAEQSAAWRRLRSFHAIETIAAARGHTVVSAPGGEATWVWLPLGKAGILLVGTDLHRDLMLIRQGAQAAAANRPAEEQWGIAGERPTYLFEGQLDPDRSNDRQADWWMWTLRDALCRFGGVKVGDVLPFGAPGAVIVTGDDDQAPLYDYREQGRKLGALPITYFLHPLTKHDRTSLAEYSRNGAVEWELHPDALDTPGAYADRLREQCAWFSDLTGHRPKLVRNHGFLNDGYWGHAGPWIAEGIVASSNLPGFDGRVLNGSLLPARLALDGALTPHWSLLTAFGDGVFFVYEWTDEQALDAVQALAQRILDSGVPGIIVLNLHPANHERAAAMHEAAHRLVERDGFAAMNLGDALTWFSQRDAGKEVAPTAGMIAPGFATRGRISSAQNGGYGERHGRPVGLARRLMRKLLS